MRIDEELWSTHQHGVLVSFIHQLAYYRCSRRLYADLQQESEFWVHTVDSYLLRAVIDWCMVFGADSNQVHWKKVVLDQSAQSEFRKYLCDRLSLSNAEWDTYWKTMTTFRNDFAAHRVASSNYPTVPTMDTALEAATTYDQWFRDLPHSSHITLFAEPLLAERYERLMRTSIAPLREMIRRGPTTNEEYEGNPPG